MADKIFSFTYFFNEQSKLFYSLRFIHEKERLNNEIDFVQTN